MKLNIQLFAGGTINGTTTASNGAIRIVWSSTKDETNNSSSVNASVQVRRTIGTLKTSGTFNGTLTINGTPKPISKYRSGNDGWDSSWKEVGSNTISVNHDEDGTKAITISSSLTQSGTSMEGNYTASENVALDTIPRASEITATDGVISQFSTIFINKKAERFTTKIYFKYSYQYEYTYWEETSEKTYIFPIPYDIYSHIPNDTWVECTIKAETYDGETKIGSDKFATFKALVSEFTSPPLITNPSIVDSINYSSLTGSNTRFIRYMSRPTMSFNVEARNYATLVSNKINGIEAESPYTASTWSDNYELVSIDSRGLPSSHVFDMDVVPYFLPSIFASAERLSPTSSNILLTLSGKFYNGYFDENNQNQNTATFYVKYKKINDTTWNTLSITPNIDSDGNFSLNDYDLGEICDYENSWNIRVEIVDLLTSATYNTPNITVGIPNHWFYRDNDGIEHFIVNGVLNTREVIEDNKSLINEDLFNDFKSNGVFGKIVCDDIRDSNGNNIIPTISLAKMHTSGNQSVGSGASAFVNNWSNQNIVQIGDFVCEVSSGRIKIPKGTANHIRITGLICGSGYFNGGCQVVNANNSAVSEFSIQSAGVLIQEAGNAYFKASLPAFVFEIPDTSKDYYVKLNIGGYNNKTFNINSGFGNTTSWIAVEKIN